MLYLVSVGVRIEKQGWAVEHSANQSGVTACFVFVQSCWYVDCKASIAVWRVGGEGSAHSCQRPVQKG